MSQVKIGFVGAGNVSTLHAKAIASCESAELVGLWSIAEDADERARAYGCRAYSTLEELLGDSRIDAVFVLTDLETHVSFATRALDAGKHVLVEKPVGTSVEEIRSLRDAAERSGKICAPGHNYIHEESLQRTKRLLESGDLGDLVALYVLYNIEHPKSAAERYPGVIRQIMTHHAYIALYLAGEAESVVAMRAHRRYQDIEQEDTAMALLRMRSGGLAHFEASFAADDHSSDSWTVVVKVLGTRGSTRYSYRDWVELEAGGFHSQTYSAYLSSIESEVRHFTERCILAGDAPLSSLEDAIEAQRIVEACERSAQEGRLIELRPQ